MRQMWILFCVLLTGVVFCTDVTWHQAAVLKLEQARFYSVKSVDLDGDGTREIVAAGQIGPHKNYRGFIAVFRQTGSHLDQVATVDFAVSRADKTFPTRVRAVCVVPAAGNGGWWMFTAGKAGGDNDGVGFVHRVTYRRGSFSGGTTLTFADPGSDYTNGYPLQAADVDGDGRVEIIYGGFSGTAEIDHPDVRIFRTGPGDGLSEETRPLFHDLDLPLRVNALAVEDADGDGRPDILIAGRVNRNGKESATLACRSAGRNLHVESTLPLPSRYRTLCLQDLDGDGQREIVAGGRMDVPESLEGCLDIWNLSGGKFSLKSRYRWTGDGSTRLRVVRPLPEPGTILAVGRTEVGQGNHRQWQGFIRVFRYRDGRVFPVGEPVTVSLDWETRLRSMDLEPGGRLLVAGFTEDRDKNSSAILMVYQRP